MATVQVPILGWSTRPDDTGECFPTPYDTVATNDVWDRLVLQFGAAAAAQPTVRHGVHGGFTVPMSYVGSPVIVIVWTASVLAGAVVWDFDYREVGGSDTESLDQTGTMQALTVTQAAAPSAAHERMETRITGLTAANFAAGAEVEFYLARDGVDAADTKAGAVFLFQALFEFADA